MIVDLAVRLPLVVKVVTSGERYPTHLKREGNGRVIRLNLVISNTIQHLRGSTNTVVITSREGC